MTKIFSPTQSIDTSAGRFKPLWLLFAALGLLACQQQTEESGGAPPPPLVNVVKITPEPLELKSTLAGRVTPVRSAEIRPQVSGIITRRLFAEGAEVQAGTQLYQIDPAPYEAALANAKGELAIAEANAHAAELRAQRYRQLIQSKAVSQQDLDETEAAWLQANARVQAAKAAVKTAQINLDYTAIRAPIAGSISRSAVTEGALVSAQQGAPLAVVRQLSPVYVDVNRPAEDLIDMRSQEGAVNPKVTLALENGRTFDEIGTLQFSESYVDPGTGSVTSRILFENKRHLLLPGMFVRATMINATLEQALLVPQRAVMRSSDGSARTYVVGEDSKVAVRQITVGRAIGDQWLLIDGLEGGEQVVISGLQKVQPGAAVKVKVDSE